jgi:hypothetical protein
VWHRTVESFNTVVVLGEWSIVLALHYSHIVVVCLYALQALTALLARTSCRPMMILMSGALEMCTRALGICMPNSTVRHTILFFMLEARSSQGAAGHVVALEPTSVGR